MWALLPGGLIFIAVQVILPLLPGLTIPGQVMDLIDYVAYYALALGAAWLLMNGKRLPSLILILLALAVFGSVGLWLSGTAEFQYLIIYFILHGIWIVALILTGLTCRRRLTLGRFAAWGLFYTFLITIAGITLSYVILFFTLADGISITLSSLLIKILPFEAGLAVFVYAMVLPYIILTFRNSLFRARIEALFRAPAPAVAEPLPAADEESIGA